MKLALVRRGYSATGGAEAYLQRFAAALHSAGHEPVLFSSRAWPAEAWPFAQQAIGGDDSPRGFERRLKAELRSVKCDQIFSLERIRQCDVFRAGDGVHAAWLERRAEYEPWWKSAWRRFSPKHAALLTLERELFQPTGAGTVIANSRMVRDEIVARFPYPTERLHVVYNGVPPPLALDAQARARAELRRELSLSPDAYVVLFAGSGWERKGLHFAVQAINEAATKQAAEGAPLPTLLVAGSGSHRRLPVSQHVRFLGPVHGLARYLAASDAFLLPTIYDPFSNACLEAMAAGLPVITTRANGFAEIISADQGTIVEQASDVGALARGIQRWSDPQLRAALAPVLRAYGARFSIEENLRQTLVLLQAAAR